MARHTDAQLAYALFRFSFGMNMAMHGASRILSGVGQFATKTMSEFAHTVLPGVVVWPFAVTLPFVELAIGVLLLFGFFTRIGLVVGSLLMATLAFGTALRGDWGVLGTQLVYSLAYYVLLTRLSDNSISVDTRLNSAGPRRLA